MIKIREMSLEQQQRSLAPFEKWYYWRNELGMYSNFRVGCHYEEKLDKEIIGKVLKNMLKVHPSLAMNVYDNNHHEDPDDDSGLVFKFMNKIRLEDVLEEVQTTSSIEDIFDSLENRRFRYGTWTPLWGLMLVNEHELIFFSDHLLIDGTSGLNFHKIFRKELQCIQRGKFKNPIFNLNTFEDGTYKLSINPSKILNYSVPMYYLLYIIVIFFSPKFLSNVIQYYTDDGEFSYDRSYYTMSKPQKEICMKDRSKLVKIPSGKLSQMLVKCKAHQVKFTSLITVLGLTAITSVTGANDTITIIPVNSRFQISQETINHQLGLYLGDVHVELPSIAKITKNDELINWDVVKYVNKTIQSNKKDCLKDLGLVSYINPKDFLKRRRDNNEQGLISTLVVSNLGYCDQLEELWFDQPCQSATLGLFSMSVIGGRNGVNIVLRSMQTSWLETFHCELNKLIHDV